MKKLARMVKLANAEVRRHGMKATVLENLRGPKQAAGLSGFVVPEHVMDREAGRQMALTCGAFCRLCGCSVTGL